MALKKGFLHTTDFFDRYWLHSATILGSLFSLFLYFLFYAFKETFRIFTGLMFQNYILVLSPKENFLYNLFYASLSVSIGLNVTSKFLIEKSSRSSNKRLRINRKHLLNDQGFIMWFWLAIIGQFLGIVGIWYTTVPLHYYVDFLEEMPIVFILLPFVLFLNTWPIVIKVVKRKGYKWMLYTFIYMAALSFAFACINLIDYKAVNNSLKQNNITLAYHINEPEAISIHTFRYKSLSVDTYVVLDSINRDEILIYFDNKHPKFHLSDLKERLYDERDNMDEFEREQLVINLHMDKEMSMKYVNKLKNELRKANIRSVQYSTLLKNSSIKKHPFLMKRFGIPQQLSPWYFHNNEHFLDTSKNLDFSKYAVRLPNFLEERLKELKSKNRIHVKVLKEKVMINNQELGEDELSLFLFDFINKYSPDYTIVFDADEEITYGRYIHYLDMIYSKVDQLQNRYSLEKYQKSFEELYYSPERMQIWNKYRLRYIEWTEDEKQLIELSQK